MGNMSWDPKQAITTCEEDLITIRHYLRYGTGFRIRLPEPGEDFNNLGDNKIVLFKKQLMAGLRIPPPGFLCRICKYFQIPLSQIHPSGIRRALTFHVLVYSNGYDETAKLFYDTQILKQAGRFYTFSSYNDVGIHFLESPPSVNTGFYQKPFIVELESGTIFSQFKLRHHVWHGKRVSVPRKRAPILSEEAHLVFEELEMLTRNEVPSMRAIVGCESALAYTGLWPKFPPEAIDPSWEKDLDIPALDFTEDAEANDVLEDVPPAGVHHDVIVGGTVPEQENHSGGHVTIL